MESSSVSSVDRAGRSHRVDRRPDELAVEGLQHVVELVVTSMESAQHASVMLMTGHELRSVAASDDVARDLDRAQVTSTDGPCYVALRRGDVTRIISTPNEDRWLSCRDACIEHHVMSVVAVPIREDDVTIGSLNLYSQDYHAFGANEIRLARLIAAQAAVIVRADRVSSTARQVTEDLVRAMPARAVVEQAKGIIMATTRCSADQAFDVLARQAHHEKRTVGEVANELVSSKVARGRGLGSVSALGDPLGPR